MNAKRCLVPVSFSVLLILAVILTVLFLLPGMSSGGSLRPGSRGTRTEARMGPEAALDSVLHVLPPLGVNTGDIIDFDRTLTEFLAVTVCEVDAGGGCTTVREFTSQENSGGGLDYIKIQHHHYHVNWNVAKNEVGNVFEIHFVVAGLDVGHKGYTPATGRTVPIKFRIDNHPRIRARLLREQGFSAIEIAAALRDEFDLNQAEVEKLLLAEDFSLTEIAKALIIVFDLTPSEAAGLMYQYGFDATEIATILKHVFSLNQYEITQELLDLNFSLTEIAKALIIVFDLTPSEAAGLMYQYGFNATEIATILKDVFSLNQDEIAQELLGLNFSHTEVAKAVVRVFFAQAAGDAAEWMAGFGYSALETYRVLRWVLEVQDEILLEKILFAAGYEMEAFIDSTAFESVKRFAPVLFFDKTLNSLPMDAADYFRVVMHNPSNPTSPRIEPDGRIIWEADYYGPQNHPEAIYVPARDREDWYWGMQNRHDGGWLKLEKGEVPTYYKVISDLDSSNIHNEPDGPKGRLRIAYWWFYGFQEYCNSFTCFGAAGEHYGDWEHIIVTTDSARTRADAVTYFFHKDWYTRPWPAFSRHGARPVVYVGKLAHGSYHSQEEQGFGDDGTSLWPWHCCEYADWRNSTDETEWYTAHKNVISLRDTLYWMRADRIGSTFSFHGKEYEVAFWRWGTSVPHKDWGCEWVHAAAVGTHPTTVGLDWTLASCQRYGCEGYHGDCAYSINPNLGWPWDGSAPVLSSAAEVPDESGNHHIAASEPVEVREVSIALSSANPSTYARLAGTFAVPRAMEAKLGVYDVKGRLIGSIVDSRVEPGVHVFECDWQKTTGARVAPGVYFLRLDTPERTITQKIVIQR